jgi:hypothetical protein
MRRYRFAEQVDGTLRVYEPSNVDMSRKLIAVLFKKDLETIANLAEEMLGCELLEARK